MMKNGAMVKTSKLGGPTVKVSSNDKVSVDVAKGANLVVLSPYVLQVRFRVISVSRCFCQKAVLPSLIPVTYRFSDMAPSV